MPIPNVSPLYQMYLLVRKLQCLSTNMSPLLTVPVSEKIAMPITKCGTTVMYLPVSEKIAMPITKCVTTADNIFTATSNLQLIQKSPLLLSTPRFIWARSMLW